MKNNNIMYINMYTMFGTARNNKNKIERHKKIKPWKMYFSFYL